MEESYCLVSVNRKWDRFKNDLGIRMDKTCYIGESE